MKQHSHRTFLLLFFLSGASALIFEIIWQRYMMLTLGASAPAITAILTAFLCGIGLGSWVGGKMIKRVKSLVKFYGLLELWIFIAGISVPLLLHYVDILQVKFIHPAFVNFFIVRFVLAIAACLPATIAMGATIPVMNKISFSNFRNTGLSVSFAYGMNTLGSVVGCLAAGFFLFQHFGLRMSTFIAGSLNLIVFLVTFFFMKSTALLNDEALPEEKDQGAGAETHPFRRLMIVLYTAGAFLALGYEVLWFRLLGIFGTNSIITLTVGLAVYLFGFTAGSLFLYPRLVRHISAKRVFFLSNLGVGITVICLIPMFPVISSYGPNVFLQKFIHWEDIFQLIVLREAIVAFILMFIPTLFMGLAYPAVCHITVGGDDELGEKSGTIYFLGSLGAGLGAYTVGQWIIPHFNLMGTVAFLCTASLIIGLMTLYFETKPARVRMPYLYGCGSILIILVLCYGVFGRPIVKNGQLEKVGSNWVYKDQRPGETISLIKYRSGRSATVSVLQGDGTPYGTVRMIFVDDQPVAATEIWTKTDAKLLAHIPLMLHPNPEEAITVGYGTGITSWSMTRYGVQTDSVEIEPEIYFATNLFSEHNHRVYQLPNFHIIINDARNYFHITEKKYDVISTDVTNLNYKNNSSLYTREYFELLKSKLARGGIVSAWVPMGGVSSSDFKILLKTFQSVYPHSSLWFVGRKETSYYSILIGTPDELTVDYARLKNIFKDEGLNKDLAEVNILDPLRLLSFFLMNEDEIRNYTGQALIHTDNNPILEFYPLAHGNAMVDLEDLYQYSTGDFAQIIININSADRDVLESLVSGGEVMCNRSGECKKVGL